MSPNRGPTGGGTGIADIPGNPIATGFTSGEVYTIDHTPPGVSSTVRLSPTALHPEVTSATYHVAFCENVVGVGTSSFSLATPSGTAAGTIVSVTPGVYIAQLSSADSATGIALFEIYELPED